MKLQYANLVLNGDLLSTTIASSTLGLRYSFIIHFQTGSLLTIAKIYLVQPIKSSTTEVSSSRLEFEVSAPKNEDPGQSWCSVTSSDGVWATRLFAKPLVRDIVIETYTQLRLNMDDGDRYSFVLVLARMIDLVHPSQKIQTAVMAYPANGVIIIKKRLLALGYNLGPTTEDSALLDASRTVDYLKQINKRLEKEHHFYFEFSSPNKVEWRVGFTTEFRGYNAKEQSKYPGQEAASMGIGSDGMVHFGGKSVKFVENLNSSTGSGLRTWGLLVDLYFGHISLVSDGHVLGPVFGAGATHFTPAIQKQQRMLILTNVLFPMLSLPSENFISMLKSII